MPLGVGVAKGPEGAFVLMAKTNILIVMLVTWMHFIIYDIHLNTFGNLWGIARFSHKTDIT